MSEQTNAIPVDELAEEFALRWRNGERPSIEEYAARYPEAADEIRAVLPAVVMMEQLKPRPDTAATGPAAGSDDCPERIGEYRILREIGRGGMGVVYEAEQETLRRRVAVKVLPRHLLANDKVRSRFHQEAQAAARLHHTNIVPVFGVGEDNGHCFYVMQLIDGRGLDHVIRETRPPTDDLERRASAGGVPTTQGPHQKRESANTANTQELSNGSTITITPPPESALSYSDVARLGAQVADALAYAHEQGIVHRDIKPSNLLLDPRGAVWVTDFGVAKIVEGANLTQSGDLIGTLKYMPPERFDGVSDGRGDVYSLGVTLYELLTLRSAFPDTTPHHLIQLITNEAPVRPRKLNPNIPTDLETIVLKAAARDPFQRYQSPGELADDLRRFLDDRPILAKRTGAVERLWRWCRRNPALASAVAATFVLMLIVTAVSVAAYFHTSAANRETKKALAAEQTQREHAEQTSTLALAALNRIYERFAPTRLVATPTATSEEGVELPPQPAALPAEAIPLLEDLLKTYEQIARSGGEFPRLQAQAAEADHRIGDIRRRLGRLDDAAGAYRLAIDLYAGLPASAHTDGVRIKQARAYNELGRTLRALNQLDDARHMHESALKTLAETTPEFAQRPECRYEMACSYYALGQRDMFLMPGRPGADRPRPPNEPGRGPRGEERDRPPPDRGPRPEPGGDSSTRRAIEILVPLVETYKTVPEYKHLLACCFRDLPPERGGPGGRRPGDSPGSVNGTDRAITLLRELVNDYKKVPDYRLDLCETLACADRGPSGEKNLQEAIDKSVNLCTQYPTVPEYAAAQARYRDRLGIRLFQAGELEKAEVQNRKAVEVQSRLVKQHPEVIAYSLWLGLMERSLGQVLGERGDLKEGRSHIEAGIARVEALWKKEPRLGGARPFLGLAYRNLEQVLTKAGDSALAVAAHRKADEYGGPNGPGPRSPRDGGPRP